MGILLSTLHQSSLGSLFLIFPEKMHPFWYTPAQPFFFFISAIICGLAMTIFESTLSARSFGRSLERSVITELSGVLYVALWVMALLRLQDYYHRGVFASIFKPSYEAYFLWLELALAFVIPLTMLSFKQVPHQPSPFLPCCPEHHFGLCHQPPERGHDQHGNLGWTSLCTEVDRGQHFS